MRNAQPAAPAFADLGLDPRLLQAVTDKGYTHPSPIQAQCIPPLLAGRDVLGCAQTGTGKTAAFALPLLQLLLQHPRRPARRCFRVLVLTPTRELASQIHKNFLEYSAHAKISCAVIYGGVGFQPQIRALQRGLDVLIATPGRLLDLEQQGHVCFDQVAAFVLDEADRMLDMGFLPAVKRIAEQLPVERQSLMFSATMPRSLQEMLDSLLHDPVRIAVAPVSSTADNISQEVCFVDRANKKHLLLHLIGENPDARTIVFMQMKHAANKLAEFLSKNGISADAIHGNKSQNARERALDAFRKGKVTVLVATDVASRGLDIKGVDLVINYDLPKESEAYVHRIGRTARAGASGQAMTFVLRDERSALRSIEKLIQQPIPVREEHPFLPGAKGPDTPEHPFDRPREAKRPPVGYNFRRRRNR